ncbi:hypothetical protein [Sphingomonas sp.]|uniref:hypothetical protein n=1 Tax=Sphingomonas sp. TaxID=28214 RepID=UPI003B003440
MYTYLDRRTSELAEADLFVLSAMRGWVAAARGGRCVCHALARGFEQRGVLEALMEFATAMALVDRFGRAQFRFGAIACVRVTDDEARLLSLFALGRAGDREGVAIAAAGTIAAPSVPRMLVAIDTVSTALTGDAA